MSLISVYIPTHNRSLLLKRAVDSVLSQTYKNIEIIVVDDGSSDDTMTVLKDYARKYENIVYFKQGAPKGACAARNLAISKAKGKYITGLDDDDEFLPNHLETLINNFDDKYSFVASSLIEDTGSKKIKRKLDCGVITLNALLHYNKIGNQIFTLTERLLSIGGFDEEFPAFQDYDTWVRLVNEFGDGVKLSNATYIWHTAHEKNRISNNPEKRLLALKFFSSKHSGLLSKEHLNSIEVIRIRLTREEFSLRQLLILINIGNWKGAIALYANKNLTTLKKFVDSLRR